MDFDEYFGGFIEYLRKFEQSQMLVYQVFGCECVEHKKKPRALLGAFTLALGLRLVFDDANCFGCFGYFQEVDAASNLVNIDRC